MLDAVDEYTEGEALQIFRLLLTQHLQEKFQRSLAFEREKKLN